VASSNLEPVRLNLLTVWDSILEGIPLKKDETSKEHKEMARAVGIDLGTTNSCVSVLEGGEPTVIANAEVDCCIRKEWRGARW
jgi:hypothetical protein